MTEIPGVMVYNGSVQRNIYVVSKKMKIEGAIRMLENEVLEFEKRVITESEMAEHVNYYYHRAIEGMKILYDGDKAQAMKVLRELNNILSKEYKHYQLSRVSGVIDRSPFAMAYAGAIIDAHAHQTRKTSYEMLDSNLDDIQSYMQFHCGKYIQEK
jgi:hypothetical protein